MPPLPPRSTCSPCRSATDACASVLGHLRGAERCSRSFASSLASRSSVCSCSTYAVRFGRESGKP
eukprot:1203499-Pleurochrysis_carterae.AAC.1